MGANTIEEAVLAELRELPPDQQDHVLDFARSLRGEAPPRRLKPVRGLCANLGVRISEEEIAVARREMWGGFPRERFFE